MQNAEFKMQSGVKGNKKGEPKLSFIAIKNRKMIELFLCDARRQIRKLFFRTPPNPKNQR